MGANKEDWYINYGDKKLEETKKEMYGFLEKENKNTQENKDIVDRMLRISKQQYKQQILQLSVIKFDNEFISEFIISAKSMAKQNLDLNCANAFTILRVYTRK